MNENHRTHEESLRAKTKFHEKRKDRLTITFKLKRRAYDTPGIKIIDDTVAIGSVFPDAKIVSTFLGSNDV